MRRKTPFNESLLLGLLLALSGGLMDAYSYLFRGGVFANAQTGNILLLGVNLANGEWAAALKYVFPVAAFSAGITAGFLLAHFIRAANRRALTAFAIEICVFLGAALFPHSLDSAANSLISFACGVQLESFGKISGVNAATTMCIGNLRLAIENGLSWCVKKQKTALSTAAVYALIIVFFALGAVLGSELISLCGKYALWGCAAILAVCACATAFSARAGE